MTEPAQDPVTPTNGMVVQTSTRLTPGVYLVPDGLRIDADGVTLDGNGATLIGRGRTGVGITISGRRGVTIRSLRILEFEHGLVARHAPRLAVQDCHITSTAEVPANSVFLDIWRPVTQAYGGALLLDHVDEATITHNDFQHQMCGVLAYHCRRLLVRGNNASYSSGAGFYLHDTCDSTFERNWADYCLRYEPRDPQGPLTGAGACGHMGADAAGFVAVVNSSRNVFRRNSARCGGDGFFLAGCNAAGERAPCNDNLFEENDGSLSPNIAFEATFCQRNVFRNNWADRCNFGFWLGYSSHTLLEGNRLLFNRQAGVAVEHGVRFDVRRNDFQSNGHGILLWTCYNAELLAGAPENETVRDWLIEDNKFYRNGTAIAILADREHGIRPLPPEQSGRPTLRPRDNVIRANDIQDNRLGIHLACTDHTTIDRNKINRNVEADLRREDDTNTVLGHNLGLRGAYL